MNKSLLLSIAFCLPFAAACGGGGGDGAAAAPTPSAAQTVSASLASGAFNRTYLAYVPAKTDTSAALPLVIALHGGGGSGAGMRSLTGLDAAADANGFVVAYPDGYATSWADGRATTDAEVAGVDDVAFASALIDDIAARTPVDRSRVYVTGISNGGMMSLRLACQLSEKIAAAAPVAANMPVNLSTACAPSRPVPTMFIHGDLDPLMPRNGGVIPLGAGGSVSSTAASVAFWNDRNGCASAPTETSVIDPVADNTSITLTRYAGCTGGGENRFYDVVGGGHTWPSGVQYQPVVIIGRTSGDIDANQEIWRFFRNSVR
jgi:polyhydroxybutyrate depolymerase